MDPHVQSAATSAAPPNVSLFLRNLRLLDLDLLPDWPDITPQTFSSKDANLTLRSRVKCVEWALYQLFSRLSPDDANNKLRPFFPPLEPLQSVNLRAALFRCLAELKKDGKLERDVTLRKTTLDECRGDRFEELLAAFSTLVLRKVAAESSETSPALRLALEPSLSEGGRQLLMPLIVAHRVGITKLVQGKSELRRRYGELGRYFGSLERELDERAELTERSAVTVKIPSAASETLRAAVLREWTGDTRWAEEIIAGGKRASTEVLLESDFDKLHHQALRDGRLGHASPRDPTVLEDLNQRIQEQRARIQKWADLQRSWSVKDRDGERECRPARGEGLQFTFQDHKHLKMDLESSDRRMPSFQKRPTSPEYESIIAAMEHELKNLRIAATLRDERSADQQDTNRRPPHAAPPMSPNLRDALHSHPLSQARVAAPLDIISEEAQGPHAGQTAGDEHREPAIRSPTQPEWDEHPIDPPTPDLSTPTDPLNRRATLMERTRQSMSLLPNHNSGSRASMVSRPPRPSSAAFPINPFETPQNLAFDSKRSHSTETPISSGAATPKEELFSQDADYASVFKSRPRVALSPDPSPSVRWQG